MWQETREVLFHAFEEHVAFIQKQASAPNTGNQAFLLFHRRKTLIFTTSSSNNYLFSYQWSG